VLPWRHRPEVQPIPTREVRHLPAHVGLLKGLFKIEESIAGAPRKKREAVRAKKSQKIVDAFFQWCETQAELALDGSPIAKALLAVVEIVESVESV